jgi:heptosyltransferase III
MVLGDTPELVNGSSRKGKILVIRGGAIGDFILTLPVFAALRQQFPNAHLEVLGYPHIAGLALAGGLVDRVQAIESRPLAGFFARNGELAEDWRDYFSDFDIIVSYLFDPDEIFKTNVLRCAHGQYLSGAHRPDESEGTHASQVYLRALERLAIFEANQIPQLTVAASGSGRQTIAIHPGSGSEKKNWAESNWADLLGQLAHDTELNFLLVGGEAEGERLKRLGAKLPADRVQVAQSLPLPELAKRLRACDAFVGHDSGITHLAAALGLPCLALWAHTSDVIWRPQGERVRILKDNPGLSNLKVSTVTEELKFVLGL